MMPSLLFNRPMLAAATPTSRQFRCAKIPLRPSVSRSQSLAPSTWAHASMRPSCCSATLARPPPGSGDFSLAVPNVRSFLFKTNPNFSVRPAQI